jgi:hypothetical protein
VAIFARSGDLSVAGITAILHGNHEHFSNDPEHHFEETNKLDAAAAIERLTGDPLPRAATAAISVAVLGLTAMALWSASGYAKRPEMLASAASTTSALAILAMYLCVYHLVYDGILLAVPALAAAVGRHPSWNGVPRRVRWLLTGLLVVPFVNVLWTGLFDAAMARLGIPWGRDEGEIAGTVFRIVSAANGVALLCGWMLLLPYVVWRPAEK